MIVHGRQTSTRERALASVEKRIGEVEACAAAWERAGDRSGVAAARRLLDELRQMLAEQRGSRDAAEG